jgi:hypothetical protein
VTRHLWGGGEWAAEGSEDVKQKLDLSQDCSYRVYCTSSRV